MTDTSEQLPLLIDSTPREDTRSRNQCSQVIRDEFHLRNFGFEFYPQEVFYYCQWHWPRGVFLFYRCILLAYAMIILVMSIVIFDQNKWHAPWPIFMTHWSYFMLTVHLLVATIICVMHVCDEDSDVHIPLESGDRWTIYRRTSTLLYMKLSWLLFVIASGAAFIVTCIYFGALFPQRGISYLSVVDVNIHLMNSVIIILEFIVSALPVRFLHGVYVIAYGLVYIVFSIIYWSFDHANVIYPGVLDWNYPLRTLFLNLLVAFIGIPVLQALLFGLYSLRLFVYRKIRFRNSY